MSSLWTEEIVYKLELFEVIKDKLLRVSLHVRVSDNIINCE